MSKSIYEDIILSFAAFFQVAVLMLQELLIGSNIVVHESFRNFSIALSALPMVPAAYVFVKRKFTLVFFSYLIVTTLILLTFILHPTYKKYLNSNIFYLLCINLPCFLCIASIKDTLVLSKVMLFLSYLIFILGIIYLYLLWIGSISFSKYSMSFSYYLLLPGLVFAGRRSLLFSFAFLIICFMMLMLGSRGALIIAIIFAFSMLFIDKKNRSNILIITFFTIVLITSGSFISTFLKLLGKMNITSRTLDLLLTGDIIQDSSRFDLYSITWNSIMKSPHWGYGIYGDRVLLHGNYCHNIFLEISYDFGLFIGIVLILLFLVTLIRNLIVLSKFNKKTLLTIFFYGFIPLVVSGSYLNNAGFGLFVGSLFLYSGNNFIKDFLSSNDSA